MTCPFRACTKAGEQMSSLCFEITEVQLLNKKLISRFLEIRSAHLYNSESVRCDMNTFHFSAVIIIPATLGCKKKRLLAYTQHVGAIS